MMSGRFAPTARRFAAGAAFFLAAVSALRGEEKISIEGLLKSGWQIAGFAVGNDNRSSLILFRHPMETHLVQCASIYDVTRQPRTFSNCYELR